ncbi:MAG: hypothetical protein U1C46_08930 [Bacteroidales bacterium]|nr:hypothetical protein [Bacteroidales bacterium]MDZ4204927.1 hypothetical protein [Bacteroidales bacterium]
MRRFLFLIASCLILSSCSSLSKQMQQGNYDTVIEKSVKKLLKKPSDEKYAQLLDKAFILANERDWSRVRFLKIENNPNTWDEVFRRYDNLKARQAKVRTVLPINLNGQMTSYEFVDYDSQIVEAKNNAAQYFFQNAQKLLQNNDRFSNREAYTQLLKARDYSGGAFPGLHEMITKAQHDGMTHVLVMIENHTGLKISLEFEQELLAIDTRRLNSEWVHFHQKHLDQSIEYDYLIIINLTDIMLSPDQTKENDVIYRKEIQDGFNYALDAKGNVRKDSLGNDIKVAKYKTLVATLIEKQQHKEVAIKGLVEFIELKPTEMLLAKEPIVAQNVFRHISARAVGDMEALDDEAKKKIKNQMIPFPGDFQMILNCAETLKPAINGAIQQNRRLIQ